MSAGGVWGSVVLDNPGEYHCGPNDPVTGHVALTFQPSSRLKNAETPPDLFGPLKIFCTFQGRAKTKIHKSNGNTSSTYRGRAPLFHIHKKIYDGTYKSTPGHTLKFRFSFNFPPNAQPLSAQGDFRQDMRFCEEHGHPLPPTFSTRNTGFSKSFVAFTEYRIGASFTMPGIDIAIHGLREEHNPVVLYEQPRIPAATTPPVHTQQWGDCVNLQNEHLLPEDERPTGFRQKTKFMLSSEKYPTYMFDVIATVPREIYMGQPLVFEVSIHPNIKQCTAPLPPEIKLHGFHALLRSHTTVRAEHGFLYAPEASTSDKHPVLECCILDPDEPFSKGNDHTKTVRTRDGLLDARSSFKTYNISHSYSLDVDYSIFAAGKHKRMKRTFPLHVYPPLDDGREMLSTGAAPGSSHHFAEASSSAAGSSSQVEEPLAPPLDELAPTNDLPQYERPPEYADVLEARTEDDVLAVSSSVNGKGKAVAG